LKDLEIRDWRPGREHTLWLAASLALVLAPHALRLPPWVVLGFTGLAAWRLAHAFHGVPLPGRAMRLLLGLAVAAIVYASYGTLFGRNAGIAALTLLAGMKLLETESLRDAYAGVFLGYFLVITNFLYSQSIPTGLYMLGVVVVMTATLSAIQSGAPGMGAGRRLRLAATLLAQALPLMVILFVLFPRIPGPLWGLPKDAHTAVSGLTDTMAPGSISQLGLSTAVAFRVEFEGPIPPPARLYWRGPVLTHTDGRRWSQAESRLHRRLPALEVRGPPVYYAVTLEPHQQRWLFALEVPGGVQAGMRINDEFQLLAPRRLRERLRYRLRSFPEARITEINAEQRRAALALPEGMHARARALAEEWRRELERPGAVIARALAYFRSEPFYYTLRAPLLIEDPVDQFLFESRRGFCEHYASAFTVLMRAAGIPARVVTGYQGGERNPLGDYLIVRQRDAHAWVEVWLEERGWVRVDPTAAVSPDRIELGMDATLPAPGMAGLGLDTDSALAQALRSLRHGWDAVNNTWNQWILAYGPARQKEFLSRFGLDASRRATLAVVLLAVVGVALGLIAVWLARRRPPSDRALRAYQRFCAKAARTGVERRGDEGPLDFAARLRARRPDLEREIARVTELYVRLRYAGRPSDARELERVVAAFRP